MNITAALDILGPLVIALGTLPVAAGIARVVLDLIMAVMGAGRRVRVDGI